MVARMKLILGDDEFRALYQLSKVEMRGLSEQARFIIRKELERLGLLEPQSMCEELNKINEE